MGMQKLPLPINESRRSHRIQSKGKQPLLNGSATIISVLHHFAIGLSSLDVDDISAEYWMHLLAPCWCI